MIATGGDWTNPNGKVGYRPEIYEPQLKENLRDNTFMTRITNSDFKGKFKNKGDKIIIRHTPLITTKAYTEGVPVEYEDPEANDEEHTISRSRYYAFKVRDVDQALSDVPNFAAKWTTEGAIQLGQDIETEFLNDIYAKCDAANKGNTAGVRSQSYDLGSTAKPLMVYKTAAEAAAAAGTNKAAIADAIAAAGGALAEQPGTRSARPWIIIPVAAAVRIQTSELKDASLAGDSRSMLREGVESIGSIAGFDIYQSNLLPIIKAGDGVPQRYVCLFGDNSAITYADEINQTEMLRAESGFSSLHRSLCVYDWFVRYKERFGHMVIALG